MGFIAPAMDGRDPLGFLSAAGTLRLLADHVDPTATLAFDETTGQARFAAQRLGGLEDCIAAIEGVIEDLGDACAPGMPADFPPPGAAPDRLRVDPAEIAQLAASWTGGAASPELALAWVRALVTDLAVDNAGRAAITRFASPSGKQSFSTMLVGTRQELTERPGAIREAFLGWRRVAGYTGEYLDHRVLMSGADAPSKADIAERGVPGATWLALMALPMFPATASGRERTAIGWQRHGRDPVLCWPLWRDGIGRRAIEVLINHPGLRLTAGSDPAPRDPPGGRMTLRLTPSGSAALSRLGVFAVCVAARKRIPGRKSDGVLVPRQVLALQGPG